MRKEPTGREPQPRVIVGVDGSYGSLEALRVAVGEALRREWPLVLAHVVGWVSSQEGWDNARQRGHAVIADSIRDALGSLPSNLQATSIVVERLAPGPGLIHLAGPDSMLVVGARLARSTWRTGVDTYLVRNAPCPVLTVPAPQMLRLIRTSRRERRDWRRGVEQLPAIATGE